jgi:RNA polymerase sigma-70 factor (ECF subfamily)
MAVRPTDTPASGIDAGGRLYSMSEKVRPAQSDADLIAGCLRGEGWATAALWERTYPLVHRILCRAVGPGQEVDDLLQEVFIRFFRKLPTLRDPGALRGFVLSIVTRVVQSELRARWIKRWLRLSDDGALPEQAGDDVDHEARQALARFYAILDGLGPKHRTVFVLRCIEGLELVEVAQAVGVSLATIKRWLPRITRRVYALAQRDPGLAAYIGAGGPLVVIS